MSIEKNDDLFDPEPGDECPAGNSEPEPEQGGQGRLIEGSSSDNPTPPYKGKRADQLAVADKAKIGESAHALRVAKKPNWRQEAVGLFFRTAAQPTKRRILAAPEQEGSAGPPRGEKKVRSIWPYI